ncbi:MAG: hypothetical protein JEZ09_14115 [Salinivirgaceae bacterium]|nr:hypothetical protein [Salinivirgaceae bacterium]
METLIIKNDELKFNHKSFSVANQNKTIDVYEKIWHKKNSHGISFKLVSPLFEDGNFHFSIKGGNLKILLTEIKEINSPYYVHHLNRNLFKRTSYERLRSFNIELPQGDFYIDKSNYIAELNMIKLEVKGHLN